MKSVGEAMAIGRTFKEALQKALRSLEIKRFGLCGDGNEERRRSRKRLRSKLERAERRADLLSRAGVSGRHDDRRGLRADEDRSAGSCTTSRQIVEEQNRQTLAEDAILRRAKQLGFSDRQLAVARGHIRSRRSAPNAKPRA